MHSQEHIYKGKVMRTKSYMVHSLIESALRKEQFQNVTREDNVLMTIQKYMEEGWPSHMMGKINEEVKQFSAIRNELSMAEGLFFYGDKIIVPMSLQKDILKTIHGGHQGIVKCKLRARGMLYWPMMNRHIEDYVASCEICQLHRNRNPRQPLLQHDIPRRPWEKVAMDIATYKGDDYLVVIDYYSKWLEVIRVNGKTANVITKKLNNLFSIHGYPDEVVSNNVPFNSEEFRNYLRTRDIKGTTSSPNYSRSNGLAERAVGLAKTMLSKSSMSGEQLEDYLIEYRSSHIPGIELSPAQLLFSRQIKNKIPCLSTHYEPVKQDPDIIRNKLIQRQENQKKYFDRGTVTLPSIKAGDRVLIREKDRWKKGEVVGEHESPRSHIVKDGDNKILRRNREHLILVKKEQDQVKGMKEKPGLGSSKAAYNFRDRTKLKCPIRYESPERDKVEKGGCGV